MSAPFLKSINELSAAERFLLERVAREQAKYRLLLEIRMSLAVCRIEGWNAADFLNDIKTMINQLGNEKKETICVTANHGQRH